MFRVNFPDNGRPVLRFLAVEWKQLTLSRVSYRSDNSGLETLLAAAKGSVQQLHELESQMKNQAVKVRRARGLMGGVLVLRVGEDVTWIDEKTVSHCGITFPCLT